VDAADPFSSSPSFKFWPPDSH